ncbi:Polynucleotide adenylyltransferase region [Desulfobulbus propionicus DSM 2032]|uniref:Polynucleotide adenylyltransferase region n=1 Tax=Desulfobulbus propionicus (strain ATCC 33891 / DSM 2032 / VKM B-1956 / 1pr3) TaxID=577650 RepID=A0A7U4DQF4_DESPD|nr:CBS domain-containing protein [Desulfobulbus propionicus]ADW19044.1 Polynucleotide adenylyltransferase region [Desulfobulbus propionicus DSM 2032]
MLCIIPAMDIITTHIGADFDSLAAMVAAKKLYPRAELVFPGSQEKCVRDYLAQEFRNIYEFKKIKHIDLSRVQRLIVVDTRQAERIGGLAECLTNPHLTVHLYDHHPDGPGDLRGSVEEVRRLGSTTTLFVRLFQERGIVPSRDEATLMALGIYEDTGSFLHSSTCPEDLSAAAWLLSQGANLDVVTQFVSRELSAEQIGLIGRLQQEAHSYVIRGVTVVISTLTEADYINDFAVIVQRLMVMENIDVLFALISMGERTYLIARSRIPEVNVGTVAREFGGGGHAAAASATIRDLTLAEAEEQLVGLLHRHIRPKAVAGELMSAPVIAVTPDVSIDQANRLMTRYNVTVLPVVRTNNGQENGPQPTGLLGMISRMVAEKAIFHQLGSLPVADYMTTEIATLPESGTLADIQRLIVENRQRLIPVVRGEQIVGVITRTDLLGLLVNDPANLSPELLREDERPSVERTRNLGSIMAQVLPREITVLLREIGETAAVLGCNAYVAGGFVRDLLLHVRNTDIDIVIEGDGIRFAKTLAEQRHGVVHPHEKFGTATVIFPDQSRVDVATARLEYYEHPAALPTVEHSSIKLDLYRRDFTINAMAIHLNPERFGTLVDYFNCQNDLKERRIQVLHNLSFVEDPTRIFRAIRFEGRLDFTITRHAEKLIKNTVQMNLFEKVEEPRFFHELKLILSEDDPIPALRRMAQFKLFPFLWPDLRPNLKVDRRFLHTLTQANQAISWFKLLYLPDRVETWMVYLLAIMSRSRTKELISFCHRFDLPPKQRKKLIQQKTDAERIAQEMQKRPFLKPSETYWLLGELDIEGLLYLMTIARKRYIQQAVSLYVTTLRKVVPLVGGDELKTMGYIPGPQFRAIHNHLIEMQLDGEITSHDQALAFIRSTHPILPRRP